MPVLILAFLTVIVLHEYLRQACAAVVEVVFDIGATFAAALDGALRASLRWLKLAPLSEPGKVAIAAALAAAAAAVARADFRVLAQSFDLILPAGSGGTEQIAFSMVCLTAGTGVLLHSVRRPVQAAGCAVLACLLIATQGATAYTRTRQLDEARAVAETFAPLSAGSLAIAGQHPATPVPAEAVPEATVIDAFGPGLSAVIAALLGAAQLVLTWGVVLLGGSAAAWVAAAPVLALLAAPRLVLGALFARGVREQMLAFVLAVFGLFAGLRSILARFAPALLTAEAYAYRMARLRRAAESSMEEFELAATAAWRAEVEAELRQSERSIFRDFLAEHAAKRRECFRALLDEAVRRSPTALAHLPERIVRIWLWPLQKASGIALMIGGDRTIKTRSAQADASGTAELS